MSTKMLQQTLVPWFFYLLSISLFCICVCAWVCAGMPGCMFVGMCNCFQTHKRFKRLKFMKAMFWYYCFENKTDDSQPIRSFSLLEGKQSDWFLVIEWALTWLVRNGIANSHWFLTIEWTLKFEWILTDEGNHFRTT